MGKQIIQIILKIILKIVRHKLAERYRQFLKYCIGGGIAFVIDVSLLYIFTEFCGIWYLLSATLSFCISGIFNYLFQKFITFKSENKKYLKQFSIFILIALVGLLINNFILYVLVEYFGIWYLLAKAAAAVVVLIWNFIANKKVTFKKI